MPPQGKKVWINTCWVILQYIKAAFHQEWKINCRLYCFPHPNLPCLSPQIIGFILPKPLLDRIYCCLVANSCPSRVQHTSLLCPLPSPARQPPLSSTISWSLLKFMSIELVMPSNHLIFYHPFLLLPWIFPSIGPSNEYSGLISFRNDRFGHGSQPCEGACITQWSYKPCLAGPLQMGGS